MSFIFVKHFEVTFPLCALNSLVDSVVDEQLREHGSEDGGGDAQTEAAPGPIERPPETQR